MDEIITKALTAAPALVISLGGVAYISKSFLTYMRETEKERKEHEEKMETARKTWAENRHSEFFRVVADLNDQSNACIRENTKVVGAVLDRMKDAG